MTLYFWPLFCGHLVVIHMHKPDVPLESHASVHTGAEVVALWRGLSVTNCVYSDESITVLRE